MLGVHVIVKIINLEISRCRLADFVRSCVARLFFLFQPMRSLLSGVVVAVAFLFA